MILMFRALALGFALMLAALPVMPARAAAFYVDNALGELAPEARAKITDPKPVQLLFQFTTEGKANARAAKYLTPQIFDLVRKSGLFSQVSETPVAGGAVLLITIDNIPQKNAAGKGFAVGLSFGLAGAIVIDDYTFTVEYLGAAGGAPVKAMVPHRLYTRVGRKGAPPNTTEYKKVDLALAALVRQGVDHSLNRMALDAAFGGVAAAPPAPPASPPPPPPAPEAPVATVPAPAAPKP
jgi:hypothetical protein